MDSLEEQLEQLQLITSQKMSGLNNSNSSLNTMSKKVGPAVPPKPKKPSQPQVPKSCQIKQPCEPSYSTILQQNNYEAALAAAAVAARRTANNTYSNVSIQQQQPPTKQQTVQYEITNRALPPNTNEFIPGRIYENQKMSINNVLKPVNDLPPPPPPPPADDEPNLHIYSNTFPTKKQEALPNNNHNANKSTSIYSNISFENSQNYNRLPPPLDVQITQNYQQEEEEFPPPPSPVSSSYSELRRATDSDRYPPIYGQPHQHQPHPPNKFHHPINQNIVQGAVGGAGVGNVHDVPQYNINYNPTDYVSYGGISSQGSSTYESIYEPINPRPPSQMSTRSNYSLYTPYMSDNSQAGGKIPNIKEAEVDALTDMLVNSMDNIQDVDSYGICVKCNERIVGEKSGCTAMDQIYHIACFTCYQCQINLQGKPFYVIDGKPYCEEDYLNTLEKCSVCVKPILERILRATGKPYHPQCFCCVVCGKSLDGIPFTVDATNQIHCIEDFHNKFAPRCCVCRLPILPEPGQEETVRVVALDRSFHLQCYKCEDCGLALSSSAEGRGCYPLDDHVLCKSCNAKRVQQLTNHMTTEL